MDDLPRLRRAVPSDAAALVRLRALMFQEMGTDPADPGGRHGHVFNLSTDPRRRRRGHARACLGALLAWFRDETGCRVLDLNATGQGIELYHAFGFDAPRFPALRLRMDPAPVTRG